LKELKKKSIIPGINKMTIKKRRLEFGNELYNSTKDDISLLKSILGTKDIKFISISDKLANEILQCSITLFNLYHETETETGEICLELNAKAKGIAHGSVTLQRIDETTPIMERYVKNRPQREKNNLVRTDLNFINNQIDEFQDLEDSMTNALEFLSTCRPHLDNIKNKLGLGDELYISLSTEVCKNAQNMIIATLNEATSNPYRADNDKIHLAWQAFSLLGTFDMNVNQRIDFLKNKNLLKNIYKRVNSSIVFFGDTPVPKWDFMGCRNWTIFNYCSNLRFLVYEKTNFHPTYYHHI
jgi:hypothetical protein